MEIPDQSTILLASRTKIPKLKAYSKMSGRSMARLILILHFFTE
jgi:hypothetical protein